MFLPSSGTLRGTKDLVDPHKIGRVMWSRSPDGHMAPHDLHHLNEADQEAMNHVFEKLMFFRKSVPALEVIRDHMWADRSALDYMKASLEGRSESRALMASGDWEEFWNAIE